MVAGGRTDVLSHIYIPPKSPFDKGGLMASQGLALLRNLHNRYKFYALYEMVQEVGVTTEGSGEL